MCSQKKARQQLADANAEAGNGDFDSDGNRIHLVSSLKKSSSVDTLHALSPANVSVDSPPMTKDVSIFLFLLFLPTMHWIFFGVCALSLSLSLSLC